MSSIILKTHTFDRQNWFEKEYIYATKEHPDTSIASFRIMDYPNCCAMLSFHNFCLNRRFLVATPQQELFARIEADLEEYCQERYWGTCRRFVINFVKYKSGQIEYEEFYQFFKGMNEVTETELFNRNSGHTVIHMICTLKSLKEYHGDYHPDGVYDEDGDFEED
ncbi:MAG: hypothetical protein KGI54_13560 [Pseudomonadota bacterium]|nr:hypothetical protein [Pseudomonadota bacterium]